jgi:hypothetical protein
MTRTKRMVALGIAAVVAGILLSSIVSGRLVRSTATAAVGSTGEVITVNFRGTGEREPSAPNRFVWSTDLYSMTTQQKVGTATHDVEVTGPFMADHVITFHFPDGDLVSHELETFAPDAAHPGFSHVGIHPQGNTIVPERGSGAYAGRTGRLRMSGWHDDTAFPERVTFDDFYWIELDPKA